MPLPPPPANLLAQIQGKKSNGGSQTTAAADRGVTAGGNSALMAALQNRQTNGAPRMAAAGAGASVPSSIAKTQDSTISSVPPGKLFVYNTESESFQFDLVSSDAINARLAPDAHGNPDVDIVVPLAPTIYRMTDYTYTKKEPILLSRCVNKLGVLRCLERECAQLNSLLSARLRPSSPGLADGGTIEETELGKTRFMELLSNCGVYQKISELVISRCNNASDRVAKNDPSSGGNENDKNPYHIPSVRVEGLSDFLNKIEELVPALAAARDEIEKAQTVSFHPGLGELFSPGSRLVCFPEGMEGSPLGVQCVQSWYDEEVNRATNKVKRRFILVVEFIVSVGTELVFVAASEVYPEFHDAGRNVPVRDLNHRRLDPQGCADDAALIQRLQDRGEFCKSKS